MSQRRGDDVQPSPSYQQLWQAYHLSFTSHCLKPSFFSPIPSTVKVKFGIFLYWRMFSIVHSMSEPMKLSGLQGNDERREFTNHRGNLPSKYVEKLSKQFFKGITLISLKFFASAYLIFPLTLASTFLLFHKRKTWQKQVVPDTWKKFCYSEGI